MHCCVWGAALLQERLLHEGRDTNWRSAFYMPAGADLGGCEGSCLLHFSLHHIMSNACNTNPHAALWLLLCIYSSCA